MDEILFAIPSLPHEERRHVLEVAKTTKAKLKTLPGIYEMVDKGINLSSIRDVEISDLLGRKEIKLNNDKIAEYIVVKLFWLQGVVDPSAVSFADKLQRFLRRSSSSLTFMRTMPTRLKMS